MSAEPSPALETVEAREARRFDALRRLTEVGLGLLDRLPPAAPDESAVATYVRVSRAVRLTVLLETRLEKALAKRQAKAAAEAAEADDTARLRRFRHRKDQVWAAAHAAICDIDPTAPEADRLLGEFHERLFEGDLESDEDRFLLLPLPQLVDFICRDLRLGPNTPVARKAREVAVELEADDAAVQALSERPWPRTDPPRPSAQPRLNGPDPQPPP